VLLTGTAFREIPEIGSAVGFGGSLPLGLTPFRRSLPG